jgi:hypothetical protein
MIGLISALVAVGGVFVASLVWAGPTSAQVSTLSATVGQPFNGSGFSSDLLDATCTDLRDATINWRDGSPFVTPATASLVDGPPIDIGGSTVPTLRVAAGASHVFLGPGLFDVRVSYWVTCLDAEEKPYDFNGTGENLFNVRVTEGGTGSLPTSGPEPPASCPFPAVAGSAFRHEARTAQQAVPLLPLGPRCGPRRFSETTKSIFRALGDAYWRGAVFDKTMDLEYERIANGILDMLGSEKSKKSRFLTQEIFQRLGKQGSRNLAPVLAEILGAVELAYALDAYKAMFLYGLAFDPPDPNFLELVSPPRLGDLRMKPQPGLSRRVVRSVNRRLSRGSRDAGLHLALLTSVERAGGANAAGNATAETAQLRHAAGLASALATLLESERREVLADGRALRRSGIRFRLPARAARQVKRRLFAGSSGKEVRSRLVKLGFSQQEVDRAARETSTVPLRRLTRPFPAVLDLGKRARLMGREIKALRAFATRYANGA